MKAYAYLQNVIRSYVSLLQKVKDRGHLHENLHILLFVMPQIATPTCKKIRFSFIHSHALCMCHEMYSLLVYEILTSMFPIQPEW